MVIFRTIRLSWQLLARCWVLARQNDQRTLTAELVVDVFSAEVRPGSQREHSQIAQLHRKPAYHIAPQDRVPEQVDEGEPIASRQKRMQRAGSIEPEQHGR